MNLKNGNGKKLPNAKEFITLLLKKDVKARPSAEEAYFPKQKK